MPSDPTAARKLEFKVFVDATAPFESEPFVRLFHEWIRSSSLEDELLIDVADYCHVPDGPGVLLVGHTGDYALEFFDGRAGLTYRRKRSAPDDPEARYLDAFRRVYGACRLIEDAGLARFSTGEVLVRINDRLRGPNTDEAFVALRPLLESVTRRVFGACSIELERTDSSRSDPRERLAIAVHAAGAPSLAELVGALAGS